MYEFYEKPLKAADKKLVSRSLKNLYQSIPETDGCMTNIAKEGGCGAWCCEHQSPSLFFSEFLYTWQRIESGWSKERKAELALRCVRAYFSTSPTKGCVMWDKDTKLCQVHTTRPFNCRTYGQVPEEEFKPRYEKLKVLYADTPNAVVRDQCNLVTSPKPPTKELMDEWFKELKFIERDAGIHPTLMNDANGGSYRQFHDHILLKIGSPKFLNTLGHLRTHGTQQEKDKFIATFEGDLNRDLGLKNEQ